MRFSVKNYWIRYTLFASSNNMDGAGLYYLEAMSIIRLFGNAQF